ncbi:MAG: hypothetical protein JSV89_17005 [Spirochaetaceae bacterium]|nr:MAG: hypothetical protein JSV89_17005 [Spirochaetaceae bacterium]
MIGGIAVGVWGEPRVTRDVDLKILLGRDDAPRLLDILKSDYTALQSDPVQALTRTGILLVRDQLGTRIDLLLSDTKFDRDVVKRAVPVELEQGTTVAICRPEDLIIYKLISTRLRDREDAAGVILRQGKKLDDRYVLNWLKEFEQALDDSTLVDEFQKLQRRA